MKSLLFLLFSAFAPFCLLAQAPPLPGLFYEDESDTGNEGTLEGGEATEEATPEEEISYEIVDLSPYFSMLDWSAWDNEVRAWFETCNTYASMVPPLPLGVRYSFSLDTRECTPPFDVVCSHFASVDVDDIQTWGIRVEEQIDAYGTRTFCTLIGRTILRKIAVDPSFDPTAWILSTYEPPEWLYENEEQTNYWFQTHDRSRFIMSFTVVPTGQLSSYNALMATLAAEEQQHRVEVQKDPTVFSFQKMNPSTLDVLFEFYNPLHVSLILLMKKELSDPWNLYGRVGENTTDSLGYTAFTAPRNLDHDKGFYLIVDGSTDSDGDGLPDGLELNYFKSDPQKRDTRFSGLSDWEKVYIYGLSPAERDADGDGLIDGEEIRLGTNPQKADTDDDGLTDGMEVNSLQPIEYFTWINPSETASQLPLTNATVTLSSPITMKEASYNKVLVDATGKITLTSQEDASVRGPTISAQEGSPNLYADASSLCLFEETTYNGVTCFVFTFKNLYVENDISSNRTNLQIVLTPSASNYFGISYLSVSKTQNETDGFVASIKNQHQSELARYPQSGAITTQCSLVGRLGYGTNPLKADTDDDGLNDALEVLTVYSNPLVADTDEDRLSDGDEYHKHATNPLNADTDNDTLPDWWEVQYGIDPLSASGINGKDGDPDGDLLKNGEELLTGTHPSRFDSDEDGLSDSAELGRMVVSQGEEVSSNGQRIDLFVEESDCNEGSEDVSLSIPISVGGGVRYSDIKVEKDGIIFLFNKSQGRIPQIGASNVSLLYFNSHEKAFVVAPYWDDLYTNDLSEIYLTEEENGYFIHYDKVGFYVSSDTPMITGSIKVFLPKNDTEPISIYYTALEQAFDGSGATIGIRSPVLQDYFYASLQYAYNQVGAVYEGLVLHFYPGTWTDPLLADTDGDNLLDGEEFILKTLPFSNDSDGDGLPDGWETKYNLNPLDAMGLNGAKGDNDNDGLRNIDEFYASTSPLNEDSDEDTLSDICEYGGFHYYDENACLIDVPSLTDITNRFTNTSYGNVVLDISPLTFLNGVYSKMSININGRIDLFNDEENPPSGLTAFNVYDFNHKTAQQNHILLAPAASNLAIIPNTSSILYGETTCQNEDYIVVEYRHMASNSDRISLENHQLSVQILIPKQLTPEKAILINYGNVTGEFLGEAISIGFVSPNHLKGRGFTCKERNAIKSGAKLEMILGFGSSPLKKDTDYDGLSDAQELYLGTNSKKMDTDEDGLDDCWENRYSYNPKVDNNNDNIEGNEKDSDPDNDGLTNQEESQYGANPHLTDSDGDGVNDKDELEQCSHPMDANDEGVTQTYYRVTFEFGDDSTSASEKYRLRLRPVGYESSGFEWINQNFGGLDKRTALLRKGFFYEVELLHEVSEDGDKSPDFDYTLNCYVANGCGLIIKDAESYPFGEFSETFWSDNNGDRNFKICLVTDGIYCDINRDGKIEIDTDGAPIRSGKRVFCHWSNDDYDCGDYEGYQNSTNIPGGNITYVNLNDADYKNDKIYGRADLLDFVPIWIELEEVLEVLPPSDDFIYTLSSTHPVGVVFTELTKENVSAWHTSDVRIFKNEDEETNDENNSETNDEEKENNVFSYDATVYTLNEDGLELKPSLLDKFKNGVMMLEGKEPGEGELRLRVSKVENVVYEVKFGFKILEIKEMYLDADITAMKKINLPAASEKFPKSCIAEDAPYLFFIHGFRVDERDAKGWHAEMFKRLWQSGAEINYVAVTWSGCEGLLVAINYHENVYNAFQTGAAFADLLKQVPQNKRAIVMAHSLGNIVAASAFKFHDASCETFIMLNAAIPSEAFFNVDSNASTYEHSSNDIEIRLVPEEWRTYPCRLWCTHWHQLFPYNEETQAYPREHSYTWRSLFSDINQKVGTTYNFYSSEDEVFELAESIETSFTGFESYFNFGIYVDGTFPWVHPNVVDLEASRYAWQKQEILKGRSRLAGTTTGGWKFSAAYEGDTEEAIRAARINASDEQLKQTPVFSTNGIEFILDPSEYEESEYYKLLAYAMPALSPAMGRPYIQGIEGTDMIDFKKELGRDHNIYKSRWLHSDVKDMAYFYVKTLFDEFALIINGEK